MLGGSWVVISRVISRVTILLTHIRGLITPLITTREPPSVPVFFSYDVCSMNQYKVTALETVSDWGSWL